MVKGAIIGCGTVATRYHMPSYQEMKNVQIVAACDMNEARASSFTKNNKIERYYTDSNALFENEDLDFIDICTPPQTHYELCLSSISHGVDVLVEKPITLCLDETLDLESKSRAKNIKLCVVHNYRFKDNVAKALDMKEAGKLGDIKKVISSVHVLGSFPDWLWNEKLSGGVLYDSGIHFIDIQTMFCGEPEEVIGGYINFDSKLNYTKDIYALIKYKSGATGVVDISAFSSSAFSKIDVYGNAADLHLKFAPDYLRISLGFISPFTELTSELNRFTSYIGAIIFRGQKKYDLGYHYKFLLEFVKSIESDTVVPVPIESVISTMRVLEEIKNKLPLNVV